MKVIISVDSIKFPLTGIGRYTYELVSRLQLNQDLDLLLFTGGKFTHTLPSLTEDALTIGQPASGIKNWLYSRLRKRDLAIDVFHALNAYRAQLKLKSHKNAVYHGPNFYLPKFEGPSVATFHDLSILTLPQYHPPERVRFMSREFKLSLKRASMLLTISEFTKNEITRVLGYPADKIRVIPLACSSTFYPRGPLETDQVLKKLGLVYEGYTLFTGTVEPRKNIDTLLDAYSALPFAIRSRWPLVIAGYSGWLSEKIHARIEAAERAGWARYLGFVANEDLPHLYAGARLFAFPSHFEGFGLPVLEAMASGVPVVCSNSSSLPEVSGDAALTCEPDDTALLQQLIARGLQDDAWRADAISKGLHQAAGFSWEKCAAETAAVYRELADRN